MKIINDTFELKYGTSIDQMYHDIMELIEPILLESDNPDIPMSQIIQTVGNKIEYDLFTLYKKRWYPDHS